MIMKYLKFAIEEAKKSNDPNTKVGCVIARENNILSKGHNDFPFNSKNFPWERNSENPSDTKYPYVVHAEQNAIINAKSDLSGATAYVTEFPCSTCTKLLIQAGIKDIYYISSKYSHLDDHKAAVRMLTEFKINFTKVEVK